MTPISFSHAENVQAVYTGRSLCLFIDLRSQAETVAVCRDSATEELPVVLSLTLQRLCNYPQPLSTPSTTPNRLFSFSQCDGGVGGDVVSLARSGRRLLKVTIDLSTFVTQGENATAAANLSETERTLIEQSWIIDTRFVLQVHLRVGPHAIWPTSQLRRPSEDSIEHSPGAQDSRRCDSSSSVGMAGSHEKGHSDSWSRSMSTVLQNHLPSYCDIAAAATPASSHGPMTVDFEFFPLVRILVEPALFTSSAPSMTTVIRDMTIQLGVERCRGDRNARMHSPHKRNRSVMENVVIRRVTSADGSSDETNDEPLQGSDAVCLEFNAHVRQVSKTSPSVFDVAYAKRVGVGGFMFELTVTAASVKGETVESIKRAIQAYQSESGIVDVLDIEVADAMNFIMGRFAYIKGAPFDDMVSFHSVMWEAIRSYMIDSVASDTFDDEVEEPGDAEERINKILTDA